MTKEFIVNDKYLDAMHIALNPKTRLLVNEGTIRSQKTVSMIQAFFEAVQDSDEVLHMISAENLDSIRDNILKSDFGLEVCYPEYITRRKEEFGGYYLEVKCDIPGKPALKRILLVGFGNASQWKKINGKTLGVILIDEVNMADMTFVRECFARQTSANNPKTFWTLNGDVPTHEIYTEFINRCFIISRSTTPASIQADMDKAEKQKGWYYLHWNFYDNPAMTEEKIEEAESLFPVGSYYHTIKILGERGAPGTLIYNDYMSPDLIVDLDELDEKGRPKYKFQHYTIGVDIGASRAYNAFALIGWTADYKIACVVDLLTFKSVGYDKKTVELEKFALMHAQDKHIIAIAVDSAEQNYIADIRGRFMKHGLTVRGSNKATIKIRMDMNIVALSSKRLLFSKKCIKAYDAFLTAKYEEGKEGVVREDKNLELNDIIDAVEYGQTVHLHAYMSASGR